MAAFCSDFIKTASVCIWAEIQIGLPVSIMPQITEFGNILLSYDQSVAGAQNEGQIFNAQFSSLSTFRG